MCAVRHRARPSVVVGVRVTRPEVGPRVGPSVQRMPFSSPLLAVSWNVLLSWRSHRAPHVGGGGAEGGLLSLLSAAACLGRSIEDVGHRVVPAVAVPCWTRCVVAVLERLQSRSDEDGTPGPCPRDLVKFEGNTVRLRGLRHQSVCLCITHRLDK